MNFYKKALFITLLIFIFFVGLITVLEPVVDRQLSNIFSDKKISIKLKNELLKGTKDFTPEKRIFYAGKVYFDDLNVPTFINLFTIVLE